MITVSAVAHATPIQLLCMTYEIFLEHVEKAIHASREERSTSIENAVETLKVLVEGLNFETQIAKDLFKLYVYVQGLLIQHRHNEDKLKEAYQLINMIYEGYLELAKQDTDKTKSIQNAETIYAGITYGKSDLNEIVVQGKNRGFKA